MANISLGVYHIIAQMNKHEKTYFKKFFMLENKQSKMEFALFDLINMGINKALIDPSFEEKIKLVFERKFKGENLAKWKNSLQRKLLMCLSQFDGNEDVRQSLLQEAIYIQVLIKKGLFDEAKRLIKKSEKQCLQLKDYSLEIFFEELRFRVAYLSGSYEQLNQITEKRIALSSLYLDNLQLVHLHNQVFEALKNKKAIDEEALHAIKDTASKLSAHTMPISFQFNYHSLWRNIYFLEDKLTEALFHIEKMIAIYQANSELFEGQEKVILALYADIISYGFELEDDSYYHKYIEFIRNWDCSIKQNEDFRNMQLLRLNILQIFFTKKIEDVLNFQEEFFASIDLFSDHILMAVSDCFIYAYYLLGDYQKISLIMNEQFLLKQKRIEIIGVSELLSLVLDYELGDFDIIEGKLKSIESRLSLNQDAYVPIVLDFFRKIVKAKKFSDQQLAQESRDNLKSIGYKSLKYSFDFQLWLESLVKRKKYKEMWLEQS
ncbi:MAG: hypothetical protein H6579_06510 [Chitinophagales bacterium]|nr:hypothetical protein [Bacteroidota bacterium]MCB9256761.1 hypothetical protein [Chitinophagales bacterium]